MRTSWAASCSPTWLDWAELAWWLPWRWPRHWRLGDAAWQDAYGRVLLVKMSLVGLIALASYAHVWRLRPRLVATNPHPAATLERRHWRLLRSEPLIGLGVLAAAGVLVAFPLPPRQLR